MERESRNCPTICSAADCTDRAHARGLCPKHYQRLRRYGNNGLVSSNQPLSPARLCAASGCERERTVHQLCRKHYQRWRRHGSVDANQKPGRPITLDRVALNLCNDEGCTNIARSHGQCDRHFGHNKFCREPSCDQPHMKDDPHCMAHFSPPPEYTCIMPLETEKGALYMGEFPRIQCGNIRYKGQYCRKHYFQEVKAESDRAEQLRAGVFESMRKDQERRIP